MKLNDPIKEGYKPTPILSQAGVDLLTSRIAVPDSLGALQNDSWSIVTSFPSWRNLIHLKYDEGKTSIA